MSAHTTSLSFRPLICPAFSVHSCSAMHWSSLRDARHLQANKRVVVGHHFGKRTLIIYSMSMEVRV